MDPTTAFAWFIAFTQHAGSPGCCNARTEIALPSIECKVQAGKDTCVVAAYQICVAIGDMNKDAVTAPAIECIAKPTVKAKKE